MVRNQPEEPCTKTYEWENKNIIPPPFSVNLSLSSTLCTLDASVPFVYSVVYECIAEHPIWAYVYRNESEFYGIEIYDSITDRQKGPYREVSDHDDSLENPGVDCVFGRFEPGQKLVLSRRMSVEVSDYDFDTGLGHWTEDHYALEKDKTYYVTLENWQQRVWWMYEDEMGENMPNYDRKKILKKQKATKWFVDNRATFSTVESSKDLFNSFEAPVEEDAT